MRTVAKLTILILFTVALLAQEAAKKVSELTSAEQLALRNAQVELLQAQSALQATPQYQAFQDAQKRFSEAVNQVYADRKISNDEYMLCDGPGGPPCGALKPHELALRAQPKKTAEKKP